MVVWIIFLWWPSVVAAIDALSNILLSLPLHAGLAFRVGLCDVGLLPEARGRRQNYSVVVVAAAIVVVIALAVVITVAGVVVAWVIAFASSLPWGRPFAGSFSLGSLLAIVVVTGVTAIIVVVVVVSVVVGIIASGS